MSMSTLIFCKTPLQSLIVNRILETSEENSKTYILYIPNNKSQFHKIYFDKIQAKSKFFLEYNELYFSDTLSHLIRFYKLPKFFREHTFKKIYFASLGDLVLSLLLGRNSGCKLHLFDDGTFNREKDHFFNFITIVSLMKRSIMFFLRGEKPLDTYKKLSCYHTILPRSFSHWIDCRIDYINLFDKLNKKQLTKTSSSQNLRVFIGGFFDQPFKVALKPQYIQILQTFKADIHIPHPGNRTEKFYIRNDLRPLFLNYSFANMIAEEVIITLLNSGYKVHLYGFHSTVLFNMSKYTPTISIALNADQYLQKNKYNKAGIKLIRGY